MDYNGIVRIDKRGKPRCFLPLRAGRVLALLHGKKKPAVAGYEDLKLNKY